MKKMDKIISFLFGLIILTWLVGAVIGINLFGVISDHGIKSVALCVWEGSDACDKLGTEVEESTSVVEEEDDNSRNIQ
jgi:hypothetical protein